MNLSVILELDDDQMLPEDIEWAEKIEKEWKGDYKLSNPKDLIGTDKLPMSLVPGTMKAYATLGFLEGALKYGLVNWREAGVRMSIYLDAMERHYEKFKNGEWEDPETSVPHLSSMLACIGIIIDAYECGKLTDDRPKSAPVAAVIDRFSEKVKHLRALHSEKRPTHYTIDGPVQTQTMQTSEARLEMGPEWPKLERWEKRSV